MSRSTWREQISISGECWLWTGRTQKGYGKYSAGQQAHRAVYIEVVGPIADNMELDHTCRKPLCVNPEHLEPVTRAENMRRRSEAQTECKHGHAFTPENTYMWRGHRSCRECNRICKSRKASVAAEGVA